VRAWEGGRGLRGLPYSRARGVPPLDSGLRSGWDGKSQLFPHEAWETTRQGPPRPPYPRARGVPPLDSGLRNNLGGKTRLSPHETWGNENFRIRSKIIHGLLENIKTPREKASFLLRRFFVFQDALHPLGGKCRPARGYRQQRCVFQKATGLSFHMFLLSFSPRYSGKPFVENLLPFRYWVQGQCPWFGGWG